MLAGSPDALGVSFQGVHVHVNPAYLALFGYTDEAELDGRPILDLIAPSEHAHILEPVRRRAAGESIPMAYETIGQRKDGSGFPMEVHSSSYLVDGQRYTNVVLRDLSERRAAERALLESEEKFRAISSQTSLAITITQDGRLVYANEGAARLAGRSVTDLLRACAEDIVGFVHPEDRAVADHAFRVLHPDGSVRWVEQYLRMVPYRGQPSVLATLLDVTERRRTQERQADLEAALHESQKLEAVGRLAGGVAHDFNNLLTGILGNVEFAMASLPAPHEMRTALADAMTAAAQAAELTREMLTFSRQQPIQPRPVDLNDIVRRLERMAGRLVGEQIEHSTETTGRPLVVNVDPPQMEQVLVSLVLNARDAMEAGGKLRVCTATARVSEADGVVRQGLPPGTYARLTVADTGAGLEPDALRRVFEPFFTKRVRGRGSGLGLASALGAVRQNGGTILAESTPGHGTSFHVYLPLAATSTTPTRAPAPGGVATHAGTETILLVEDERSVLAIAERVLQRQGYHVIACADGDAALAAATAFNGTIDLLLTDVIMPGLNGRQLADALVASRPGLRVLFMSGYAEDVLASRGVVDPRTPFLAKPFLPSALVQKVRAVLDGE